MDKDDTMDDREEKMGNGENMLALEVHQHGGEHSLFTSVSNRGVETNMGK
jgi:hypothetical protein